MKAYYSVLSRQLTTQDRLGPQHGRKGELLAEQSWIRVDYGEQPQSQNEPSLERGSKHWEGSDSCADKGDDEQHPLWYTHSRLGWQSGLKIGRGKAQ